MRNEIAYSAAQQRSRESRHVIQNFIVRRATPPGMECRLQSSSCSTVGGGQPHDARRPGKFTSRQEPMNMNRISLMASRLPENANLVTTGLRYCLFDLGSVKSRFDKTVLE